jgi:hypothetical protein
MYIYANEEQTDVINTDNDQYIPVTHRLYRELIEAGETIEPYVVPEEDLEAQYYADQRAEQMSGVDINGTMCSATQSDQVGLMGVLQDYNFYKEFNGGDGSNWAYFGFRFSNGAILDINEPLITQLWLEWGSFRKQVTVPYG